MQYDRMFLQSVVMNESSVYIPNDMFNGDVEALNEIVWSTKLDKIFNQNKRNDPICCGSTSDLREAFSEYFQTERAEKPGANLTCFRSFVQATQRNKKRLFDQIMNLEAYGIVNFNDVIEFAYNQFEMFQNQSVSNQGAMCNSIIMILSDGDVSGDVESA
uniref:VWA_N domain-containing protein n=1 Tax=Macrostomum lignano TaxID=282301 RepID=A0A1I8FSV5_9PLAT